MHLGMNILSLLVLTIASTSFSSLSQRVLGQAYDAVEAVSQARASFKVGKADVNQLLGSGLRNSVTNQENVPVFWDVGTRENVLWSAKLGSESYGNPVIANGKVFVASNNANAYVERFPDKVDLGVLLCFRESNGEFLWQDSNQKLDGREVDWPHQGVCCSPFADGDRVWYVSNRCEVICLDVEGFYDGENDGEQKEDNENKEEADVIWRLDLREKLGVRQLYMATCSITGVDNRIFVVTSNGSDVDGNPVAPDAPSLLCLNRDTGKVLWSDSTPGKAILHGQWSSPAYGVINGVPQLIFAAGDGWVYSFDPAGENGKGKLLWRFDANPKDAYYVPSEHSGSRAYFIGTPVIFKNRVYVGLGEEPDYADAPGHLWCIDATRRGNVSPTFVKVSPSRKAESIRFQAYDREAGDTEMPNPNSAAIWHYVGEDPSEFETTMHRTIGSVAIKSDLLFVADFSGLIHCVDANTGKAYWTEDTFSACWGSPTIVQDRAYIANNDGDVLIFELSKEKKLIDTLNIGTSTTTSPVIANSRMFIAGRGELIVFEEGAKTEVKEE